MKKVKRAQNNRIKNLKYVENIFTDILVMSILCRRERERVLLYTLMHSSVLTPQ